MTRLDVIRAMRCDWKPVKRLRIGDTIKDFGYVAAIVPYHTDTDGEGPHRFVMLYGPGPVKDRARSLFSITSVVEIWA